MINKYNNLVMKTFDRITNMDIKESVSNPEIVESIIQLQEFIEDICKGKENDPAVNKIIFAIKLGMVLQNEINKTVLENTY